MKSANPKSLAGMGLNALLVLAIFISLAGPATITVFARQAGNPQAQENIQQPEPTLTPEAATEPPQVPTKEPALPPELTTEPTLAAPEEPVKTPEPTTVSVIPTHTTLPAEQPTQPENGLLEGAPACMDPGYTTGPEQYRLEGLLEGGDSVLYLIDNASGSAQYITKMPQGQLWLPMFERFFSVSPDNKYATFVSADNLGMENSRLWLIDLSSVTVTLLAHFPNEFWVAPVIWSPCSDKIAYITTTRSGGIQANIISILEPDKVQIVTDTALTTDLFSAGYRDVVFWVDNATIAYKNNLSASSLNATASLPCGVSSFSQNDPQWKDNLMQTCNLSIGSAGCAVTSTAMVFRYYGVETQPGVLNSCLGTHACDLDWPFASSNCSSSKVSFIDAPAFSWAALESELSSGRPGIIRMASGSNTHFVVAVSGSGTSYSGYTINDPWDGQIRSLSYYGSWSLTGLRRFSGTPWCSGGSAPAPPTSVTASDGEYTDKVRVTWNSVSNATSYQVYRYTSNNSGSAAKIADANSSYEDTSASPGTTYYYWVKACNSSGCSGFSSPESGYRAVSSGPPPAEHSVQFYMDWHYEQGYCYADTAAAYMSLDGCAGYNDQISSILLKSGWSVRVYKDNNLAGTSRCFTSNDDDLSNNTFDDGSALNDQVSSFELYNQSSCPAPVPAAPTGVTASDGGYTDKVRVTWNSVSGATSYQVYRFTSNNSGSASKIADAASSYDDTSATPGTTYYYWVKACNSSGCSGYSSPDSGYRRVMIASLSASPTSVSVGGNINVSWSNFDASGNDWVVQFEAGQPETSPWFGWQYVNGTSGTVTFTAPTVPGNYDFRLYRNGVKTATSNAVTVVNPNPLTTTIKSTASRDGWVLESSETSGIGGSRNSGGSTLRVGDDAKDRQYRAFLDFNTSGLPDNAVVTSLDLRLKHAGITGTNPFKTHGNLMVDINNNAFSGNASLQLADFQAGASASSAAVVPNNISNNYYYLSLDSAACGHINTTGVTQMRLRFEKDDNDDRSADFLKLYSGDSTAANRPLLLITYYIP